MPVLRSPKPIIFDTGIDENHALPSAGRTVIGTASYRF
jgi:hypothetical protein